MKIRIGVEQQTSIGTVVYFAVLLFFSATVSAQLVWEPQAPAPNTKGQVENISDREVAGAINSVAVHPTNPNIIFVGAVNGGIWRTDNGMSASPVWKPQTDDLESNSIGALEFDPTDGTRKTLVAGAGRFSSMGREGGARSGLLRTTDGGTNWVMIKAGGKLNGFNISGVAPRGAVIVISVNDADDFSNIGVWRSTDTGSTWTKISGASSTGLPVGGSSDLAGDPSTPNQLYTIVGGQGLYRSMNTGATWTKVSSAAMNILIASSENAKIAVGASNNVYAAIVRGNELAGVFRSGNGGASWTEMGVPMTKEGGIHLGEQGDIHLSIAADRLNSQIVYVGGDRQDSGFGGWPNSIGAMDYSGRLFRGDASKPVNNKWVHLTHSNTLGIAGGGTANNSAPHADSRDMAMTSGGVLIETDDGGIYRRTNPQTNTGDWFSMNGNIEVTEFHAIAWDAVSNIVIGGTQDTGTPEQDKSGILKWRSVSTGDGGAVAVDDISTPGRSVRYSSYYNLYDFRRQVFDENNVLISSVNPTLKVIGNGNPLSPMFYSPIKLNTVNANRLIIGAANSVYESLDQGDSVTEIGPGIQVNQTSPNIIAYGAIGNPDVLYVGSSNGIFVRKAANPAPLTQSINYPGGFVMGIAIDPNDFKTAYVIDEKAVFRTTDAGGTWTTITGNLQSLAPGRLRSIVYNPFAAQGAVVIGSDTGIFEAQGIDFTKWSRLGSKLPKIPVFHLECDLTDKIIVAGTLGRGAWLLRLPTVSAVSVPAKFAETDQPIVSTVNQPATVVPQVQNQGVFQLSSGAIVDPVKNRIYVMNPTGGIDAVELAKGSLVWNSKVAAKPLGIVRQQLIGQIEPSESEKDLKVAVLDTENGNQKITGTMGLPATVKPMIVQTLQGEFVAAAKREGEKAVVTWQFLERPTKGVRPNTGSNLPKSAGIIAPPVSPLSLPVSQIDSRTGAYQMDLSTGAVSPVTISSIDLQQLNDKSLSLLPDPLPGVTGTQILSADGRHVLVSVRTGDDRVWEKYTLTLYERNGQRVGEFKSHFSLVPFFVVGTNVIYETEAYFREEAGVRIEEPLKVRAVDLKTGRELWNRQIRDTTYRGSFPP